MTAYDIILKPVITERSMMGSAEKKYTFFVHPDANKIQIAKAIEEIFEVKVAKVNTVNYDGKVKRQGYGRPGRRAAYKKATVTLTEDSKTIELFESMA